MVLYFEPLHYGPGKEDFLIYMGRDKHENEDLIRYGLPLDIWYEVPSICFPGNTLPLFVATTTKCSAPITNVMSQVPC